MNEQSPQNTLLVALANGSTWSISDLARHCGVNLSQIEQDIEALRAIGLVLEVKVSDERSARQQKWVQLPRPFQPLHSAQVVEAMSADAKACSGMPRVFLEVGSTNVWLADRVRSWRQGEDDTVDTALPAVRVCLAEAQTAGRGRSGKTWFSPLGGNIYCSSLHSIGPDLRRIDGLSLVAGLAAIAALERFGVTGLSLKWPNDVMTDRGKLAGILVELVELRGGYWGAIIGIGINGQIPAAVKAQVTQPLTDLATEVAPQSASSTEPGDGLARNRLAGFWLESVYEAVETFGRCGLEYFYDNFAKLDNLRGCEVVAQLRGGEGSERIAGTASGIDQRGRLLIRKGNELLPVDAAEVSVRRRSGSIR